MTEGDFAKARAEQCRLEIIDEFVAWSAQHHPGIAKFTIGEVKAFFEHLKEYKRNLLAFECTLDKDHQI